MNKQTGLSDRVLVGEFFTLPIDNPHKKGEFSKAGTREGSVEEKLQNKSQEYVGRMQKVGGFYDNGSLSDSALKHLVAERVLRDGVVNHTLLLNELHEAFPGKVDIDRYNIAYGVIKNHVVNGSVGNEGGTAFQ